MPQALTIQPQSPATSFPVASRSIPAASARSTSAPAYVVVSPAPDNPLIVGSGVATGLGTILLFVVALFAFLAALRQLREIKTERTANVIRDASSEIVERLLGFFDVAADIRVSREALRVLYFRLLPARPEVLRSKKTKDVSQAAETVASLLQSEIDADLVGETAPKTGATDALREKELRKRVIAAMNLLERFEVLCNGQVIDRELLMENQDYNIAGTYYVLEPILRYLVREENFDFEPVRELANVALAHAQGWLAADHGLHDARFESLADEDE